MCGEDCIDGRLGRKECCRWVPFDERRELFDAGMDGRPSIAFVRLRNLPPFEAQRLAKYATMEIDDDRCLRWETYLALIGPDLA